MALQRDDRDRPRLLLVEDEEPVLDLFHAILGKTYSLTGVRTGGQALMEVKQAKFDAVLLDVRLPDIEGLTVLNEIREIEPSQDVIMVTAVTDTRTIIGSIRAGAYDYITKPFKKEELVKCVSRAVEARRLRREVEGLRSQVLHQYDFRGMIAGSEAMKPVLERMERVKENDASVLLTGESGTGKELVARAIHYDGKRKNGPFVPVNCACFPETLLDNELFGHDRGAFTGADETYRGRFEEAHGGTLFLDEVTSMPLVAQGKLLRALDQGKIQRLGGQSTIAVDVRIISASNRSVSEAVETGSFREDVYYRLNVVAIHIPPLRDRKEDIPALVEHFLQRFFSKTGKRISGVHPEAMSRLMGYYWRGNVRQLENVIEQCAILESGELIGTQFLPAEIGGHASESGTTTRQSLKDVADDAQRRVIVRTLEGCGWNVSRAAEILSVHRNTLGSKIRKLGIRVCGEQ